MPGVQGISFAVPHTPQETSLSAQLNQFFESNPSITLVSVSYSRRERASPRPLHALTLLYYTGVSVFTTVPGGGLYHAVEFVGTDAEQKLNEYFQNNPNFDLISFVELFPNNGRYTRTSHFIVIVRSQNQCAPFREIGYFTAHNNASIAFYNTGPAVNVSAFVSCPAVQVLNLNTQTWQAYGPSLGIQAINDAFTVGTVTVGPNLHTGGGPAPPGPPPGPKPILAPCPCCFRLSSFTIQRGIADCQHTYHFKVDYNTCYSGNPVDIVKALIKGGIKTPGICDCNPPDHYMPFPTAAHYKIVTVSPFDQGYLLVICIEDLVQPCTDFDYNDIFIYVTLERCYGACFEAPILPDVVPVDPP